MVATLENHVAAISEDGDVWTWGKGTNGVLGHGDEADRSIPTRLGKDAFGESAAVMVACSVHHTMVVTEKGEL